MATYLPNFTVFYSYVCFWRSQRRKSVAASAVMSTMAAAVLLSSAASMPAILATKRRMQGVCAMRASPKSRTGTCPKGVS